MDKTGKIVKVAGPLVIAEGMAHANMFDVVRVGPQRLIGEIIEMRGDRASIQVYEETAGIGAGEEVYSTGAPLSVELGPGLIGQIYDGIQRPLEDIRQQVGNTITRGIQVDPISRKTKWDFVPEAKKGQKVGPGDVLGSVKETIIVDHKILVPNGVSGAVKEIRGGKHTIMDVVAVIEGDDGKTHELTMMQKWPVRVERPYQEKLAPGLPMVTGQRIVDTFFPIAKGGTAAIPGPFGSGKTVTQHQLAKWSDVDIVIYIGCGERGNEMTDVLREFPELKDPRTGESLMQRTVLIANTSDMPVAAREASVYTGITIAEYYRDMGYNVAVIADSTSRWAEALREMSGRLEEMPGEEGYPAYLGSRLAQFYERAGRVVCNGEDGRIGSLSAIGAVSPPGGDISEPVSQATLRIVKVFWGLDSALAYARHFPAINWLNSYSLYFDRLRPWYEDNVSPDFISNRNEAMKLLQQEAELKEIVQLVGIDALSPADRLVMETAQMIREDFLQQNAMSDTDSYCEIDKQFRLLELILLYYNTARQAIQDGAPMAPLFNIEARAKIGRAKDVHKDVYQEQYNQIEAEIRQQIAQVSAGGENA
ncbi:MAG: V-type ATP synthase subunit A [Clostridiaceae bacterium]|jgi:V/A-type H+-transporting ATPase subunit A|nr:V-type ATP synthase subunit A [Clostridiaceae bacterium]